MQMSTHLEADAAERKRMEARQEEMLRTIISNIPLMIAFYSREGQVELVNRELESKLGWSPEEWRSVDILEKCYPDPQYRQQVLNYMIAAPSMWREFKTCTRDGRIIDTSWRNIRLSDGRSIGIGQDVTERKRLEEELRQSQKMEAVGQLAAGVAHELNNPLGAVVGYGDLLLEQGNLDESAKAYVNKIIKRAEQAAKIVKQLKDFAQPSERHKNTVDLEEVIGDTLELVANQMSLQRIRIATHFDPQVRSIWADRDCLQQVFLNIALNAQDAMLQGGELTITTRPSNDVRFFEVTFADTGVGITEEDLTKVFDPFFTSGKNGQGTGLGLSISQRIVRDHGGYITAESKEGQGATFTVGLPKGM